MIFEAGMDDYLSKPLSLIRVREIVAKYIEGRTGQAWRTAVIRQLKPSNPGTHVKVKVNTV